MAIVSRFEDGQIVEEWGYYDSATMMSQLGLDAAPTLEGGDTLAGPTVA